MGRWSASVSLEFVRPAQVAESSVYPYRDVRPPEGFSGGLLSVLDGTSGAAATPRGWAPP